MVLAGCGYRPNPYGCATADGILPGERLSDWKSYADHVVYVRVVSGRDEGEGPIPDPVLTLEVLDTYFQGPGAPPLPAEVDVHARSYMLDGEEYVAPLVYFDPDQVWTIQSCDAPLPIIGGRVHEPERRSDGFKPLRELLAGTPVDQFDRLMRDARVDPKVEPYLDLRPEQRSRRVYG